MVVVGFANGISLVASVREEALSHKYDIPPEAVSWIESPKQIVSPPIAAAFGKEATATPTLSSVIQPSADVPVTLYVTVVVGFAITVESVSEEREVIGDQI